jgi:hypothetical protein
MRTHAGARDLAIRSALVLALVAGAGPAGAASAALVWTATTGFGTPGARTIQARPGDLLTSTLRIQLTSGESLAGYFASMRWDTDLADELDLVSVQELVVSDLNHPVSPGILTPLDEGPASIQESQLGVQEGHVLTCEASSFGSAITTPGTYDLCEFVFSATAEVIAGLPNIEPGLFNVPVDGFVDDDNLTFVPTFLPSNLDALQPLPASSAQGRLLLATTILAVGFYATRNRRAARR